jgi:hypothetical protein
MFTVVCSYKTRIQKEYSCLALLGLVGEDKLHPYEFNHGWGNSRRGGPCVRPSTRGRMIIRLYDMLIRTFHN